MIFKRNFYKIIFQKDKTYKIKKIKDIEKEKLLINPEHIFFDKSGNRYILTTDQVAESIDPLDFESKFSAKEFRTAVESKLINDLFRSFDDRKLPIDRILLFVNIFMTFVILYYVLT